LRGLQRRPTSAGRLSQIAAQALGELGDRPVARRRQPLVMSLGFGRGRDVSPELAVDKDGKRRK